MTESFHYVNPQTGEGEHRPPQIAPNAEEILAAIKESIQANKGGNE